MSEVSWYGQNSMHKLQNMSIRIFIQLIFYIRRLHLQKLACGMEISRVWKLYSMYYESLKMFTEISQARVTSCQD